MIQIKKVLGLLLSSIIMAAVLSGCATGPPLNTSTGKPETVINGASIEAVFNAIAEEMLLSDYILKGRSGATNIALFTARGQFSSGNIFMEVRVTYNLIEIPNGIRVMVSILEYDNPGTNQEVLWRDHSRASKRAIHIQNILNSVKNKLEKNPPSPRAIHAPPHSDVQKSVFPAGVYQATRSYENGDKYIGEFVNGQFHGKGIYTYANGDKYEGEFVNGKFTGKGNFTCSNGKQFTGNLENKVPLEFTIRCN